MSVRDLRGLDKSLIKPFVEAVILHCQADIHPRSDRIRRTGEPSLKGAFSAECKPGQVPLVLQDLGRVPGGEHVRDVLRSVGVTGESDGCGLYVSARIDREGHPYRPRMAILCGQTDTDAPKPVLH